MAKFITRLFRSNSSSSTKHRSPHGSQLSIDDGNRFGNTSMGMRPASSMDSLTPYHINPKELEKYKLHKAAWEGNVAKVRKLAGPAQINSKDQHARTALHLAVANGHFEIVRTLVMEDARLDVQDDEGRTPLNKAVLSQCGRPDLCYHLCKCIIEGGGDAFINAVDVKKKNALHYAVSLEQLELVQYFLSVRQCDPNFRDGNAMTPLHIAVEQKNPQLVAALLTANNENQVDLNLTAQNGYTPLHTAALTGQKAIVEMLLQARLEDPCDPTILDSQQMTAYQLAEMNGHQQCMKIIGDYQHTWTTMAGSRRKTSAILDEQAVNRIGMDPSKRLDDDDASTSDSSPASETASSSTSASKSDKRSSNLPSARTISSASAHKPEQGSLADLIKRNPLQADPTKSTVPKTNNPGLGGLFSSMPLQPNETAPSKPANVQPKPSSTPLHKDNDPTSPHASIEKSLVAANPLVGQALTEKKHTTVGALVNNIPQVSPRDSSSISWTQDSASTHDPKQIVQAKKVETWDADSILQSDDDDDDNNGIYRANIATTSFPKEPPLPPLSGTSMFTTALKPTKSDDLDSDEDSIEAAVRQQSARQASIGVNSFGKKQGASVFDLPQTSAIPFSPPSRNNESSWSEDSTASEKRPVAKGVNSLVQQQPLHNPKLNESMLDDSRPLSADLKRQSLNAKTSVSITSDDTDDELNEKATTIVRSPLANGAVSSLVQATIRPTEPIEPKPTGVENLLQIFNEAQQSSSTAHQKQPTAPSTIAQLVSTPLQRNDSLLSTASSLLNDAPTHTTKSQFHHDDLNGKHWLTTATSKYDYQLVTRTNSNEMIQQSQRHLSRNGMHFDHHNLPISMSSSTTSIQSNRDSISKLKEDIDQIARKQEDSEELKRRLREMEMKKDKFEALYKKNDQLLHETESKLVDEISKNQRLEWTTKGLNSELKTVKQRLESLEDEKDLLNQRCSKLKEERDNYDEKLRIHQVSSLQTVTTGVLREEDVEKIKSRHREEMKLLSAENDDLHQRTKQLQSDLQLHKESLDVTIRYKIDLEKALDEKVYLQRELDRLKHEKEFIEQEKTGYKTKYDNLQDEIRALTLDRSRLEQKLTHELQEQTKQTQRSTDDSKKYKGQIEQLNLKLGDAEARLLVLQTRNEALLAPKDRELNTEFETLKQRLDLIESEKRNAEHRYHTERQEITSKQQLQQQPTSNNAHEPLMLLTASPPSPAVQQPHVQHSPLSDCMKCDTLQRNYEREREQRLQTQRDNERLRDTVSRQEAQHHYSDQTSSESNQRIRLENERMKYELDRLRQDFDKLAASYEPSKYHAPSSAQQQPLISQADALRQLYEQELREKQLLLSKLVEVTKPATPPATAANGYHGASSLVHSHSHEYEHSSNGKLACSICSNSRLLKERLENAIDTSLADQRIQTIKKIPILPRPTSATLSTSASGVSSVDIMRKRYYV